MNIIVAAIARVAGAYHFNGSVLNRGMFESMRWCGLVEKPSWSDVFRSACDMQIESVMIDINLMHAMALNACKGGATQSEVETWSLKRQVAMAGSLEDKAALFGPEAREKNTTVELLIKESVIPKAAAMSAAIGDLYAIKVKYENALSNVDIPSQFGDEEYQEFKYQEFQEKLAGLVSDCRREMLAE